MKRKLGIVIVAVLMLSCVAVQASASAHEFVFSKAGEHRDKNLKEVEWVFAAGDLSCEKESSHGTASSGKLEAFEEIETFEACIFLGEDAELSKPKVRFRATGEVSIESLLEVKVPGLGCDIKIEPAHNSTLKTVNYKNLEGGKLEVKSSVTGITYTSSGGACGSSGTTGEYKGASELELVGGTIEWK
jgi:hypothetical protein